MRSAGKVHAKILNQLVRNAKAGMSTLEFDQMTEKLCEKYKVYPIQKDVKGFDHAICVGVNDNTVHAIPRTDVIIKEGDILTLDFTIKKDGYCADGGTTVPIGKVDNDGLRLIETSKLAFEAGRKAAKTGNRVGDIGHAIHSVAKLAGFDVLRDFAAHGIGRKMHEDPLVPNIGEPGTGEELTEGMTIALETLVVEGNPEVVILEDGWTTKTVDGKRFAYYEHTIVVTEDGGEILTKE